jgi:hypothetical protein
MPDDISFGWIRSTDDSEPAVADPPATLRQ